MPRPRKNPSQTLIKSLPKKTTAVTFTLPPAHSEQQDKLINAFDYFPKVRFVVGACGTKFGKTYGCAIRLVKEAWEHKNTVNWWVAPTFSQSENAYNFILRLLPPELCREHKAKLKIEILEPNGAHHSWIEFKSGDNPASLRGFAVNFFVIDEAAYFDEDSFTSVVTTTTQTGGRGIIISTPKGRGWFYEAYQRGIKSRLLPGEEDKYPEWYSVRLPTWVNPHVKIEEIELRRKILPDDIFRQDYAAEFLSESAGVFRNIKACAKSGYNPDDPLIPEPPQPGHRYVVGLDLAKLKDFTVIIVMDVTNQRNHVVYFDRFQGIPWEVTKMRAIAIAQRYYHARICGDSTGVGDPICEDIRSGGARVDEYKISGNVKKQQLIEKLRVGLEHQKLSYPPIRVLMQELEIYEYEISGGITRYSAPSGRHDDCVIALALAWMIADEQPFIYYHRQLRGV